MNYWRHLTLVLSLTALPVFAADQVTDLLKQANTALQHGQYYLALTDLNTALPLTETDAQHIQTLGLLGLTHYRMHHYPQAEALLQEAINTGQGEAQDRARWHIALAALKAKQNQPEQAKALYTDALKLAGNNPELQISIQLGQAQLLPDNRRLEELQRIAPQLSSITPPAARIPHLLNIAAFVRKLDKNTEQQHHKTHLKLAYASLEQAKALSSAQQPRHWAEILDGLAQLYEDESRLDEALYLNGQALPAAKSVQADDLLLDLEWRQGRLQRAKQQLPAALAAYQRAVDHIEAIRQDIPVEYHDGSSSFRETLEPVYLGLADLLLLEANKQTGEPQTHLLRRARDTVELIKQSELADFLGGRCAIDSAKHANLDTLAAGTAVLYPIILPDRLELLVSIGTEVQHFSQPITAVNLQGDILSLAHSLRYNTGNAENAAKKLYDLLIAPLQSTLQRSQVKTVVWVPDGLLRLVSPAAFYDGEHYLIEQYAVATSSGLSLFDASPLKQEDMQVLLAGMSEPGSVVDHLPQAWANSISANSTRGMILNKPKSRALPNFAPNTHPTAALPNSPTRQQTLKNILSLPGVTQEMHSLQKSIPNTFLMNETFTVDNFKHQLLQQPYSIVHIASHGVFGNTADNSFVMAYDDLITMNQLEQLLKADKFKQQPVQLLTLSACQTAEGDDRAPLGLSGIAIKAKVRSALGTLWPVDDEAAAQLMTEFYKNLSKAGVNKAQALQQAQLSLLKQKGLKHPFYWSPFILVGSWL